MPCRLWGVAQLVVAYHMNAATMGEFTKEEFTQGLLKLGCDSVDKLRKKLPELRAELNVEDKFKDVYAYAYKFSCEVRQRVSCCALGGRREGEDV